MDRAAESAAFAAVGDKVTQFKTVLETTVKYTDLVARWSAISISSDMLATQTVTEQLLAALAAKQSYCALAAAWTVFQLPGLADLATNMYSPANPNRAKDVLHFLRLFNDKTIILPHGRKEKHLRNVAHLTESLAYKMLVQRDFDTFVLLWNDRGRGFTFYSRVRDQYQQVKWKAIPLAGIVQAILNAPLNVPRVTNMLKIALETPPWLVRFQYAPDVHLSNDLLARLKTWEDEHPDELLEELIDNFDALPVFVPTACPVCFINPTDTVLSCDVPRGADLHQICYVCFMTWRDLHPNQRPTCPLCRRAVTFAVHGTAGTIHFAENGDVSRNDG